MNTEMLRKKMRSNVRLIKMEVIDPDKAQSSLTDVKNTLRLIRDTQYNTWTFKYQRGGLPPALQGKKYTNPSAAVEFLTQHFAKSGVKITGVEDVWD